jgi:hypothetical protein
MKASFSISRRKFLKNAALASATPLIFRSGLWAAENTPTSQIALGFIGMGTQGRGLMEGFINRNDTRVVAVSDVDITRRENAKAIVDGHYAEASAAGTYKGCASYNDFRELLARKDIDGVVKRHAPDQIFDPFIHWQIPVLVGRNSVFYSQCRNTR